MESRTLTILAAVVAALLLGWYFMSAPPAPTTTPTATETPAPAPAPAEAPK
jgi:hypothetical protein